MTKPMDDKNQTYCSISSTPKETQKVIAKMQLPAIPKIAINALNTLNHSKYSHLSK